MANPIYREVLPRRLSLVPQASLPRITPTWLHARGRLDPERLLGACLDFWRQHGEPMLRSAPDAEIAPHLALFERRTGQPPIAERTAVEAHTSPAGRRISVIRA